MKKEMRQDLCSVWKLEKSWFILSFGSATDEGQTTTTQPKKRPSLHPGRFGNLPKPYSFTKGGQ
jgi:hypothetical protein